MKKIRYIVPALAVLVALAVIVGAVFAVANPFGSSDSLEETPEDTDQVIEETPSSFKAQLAAAPATKEPNVGTRPPPTSPTREATATVTFKAAYSLEPAAAESPPPQITARTGKERLAPELAGISGWINSEPFTLESQRGSVVLVDFWTYTCVNCIRTLPFLKSWHAKYAESGLVILGVHSPEFQFEKLRENVTDAMDTFGIKYPVAQDNDFETWRAFNNRFWPAKYLIDKDGVIRYFHAGEGSYDETERAIRELLAEAGADLSEISPDTEAPPASLLEADAPPALRLPALTGPSIVQLTRELYAGFERNYNALLSQGGDQAFSASYFLPYVVHREYYADPDTEVLYSDPGSHRNQYIYLQGLWLNKEQSLVHARRTENYEDHIAIKFFASSVNAVMAPENSEALLVRLTLDGKPLESEKAGADVMFDEKGNSFVFVDEARMYGLVETADFGVGELRLASNSPGMELFAFTFGAYSSGP